MIAAEAHDADDLYREIRIENSLTDKRGEECASNPVRGKHLEQLLRQEMSNSERAA